MARTGVLFRAGDKARWPTPSCACSASAIAGRACASRVGSLSNGSATGRRAWPAIAPSSIHLARQRMTLAGLKVALVGPLPPPAGGMANQTRQLAELLQREGVEVTIVQVNAPYRPRFVGRFRGLRATLPARPVRCPALACRRSQSNSSTSWPIPAGHGICSPRLRCGSRLRGTPAVVNYRGGEAESFLARSGAAVRRTLRRAASLVVPSGFLQEIFGVTECAARSCPTSSISSDFIRPRRTAPPRRRHLVVARNLEPIYDIATALARVRAGSERVPDVRLTIAGSGPERADLKRCAHELGIADAVVSAARSIAMKWRTLYRLADGR